MAQTMTVSTESFKKIISRLDQLTREVQTIKTRLFDNKPSYGSSEWWEWSDRKALKSIREGKGIKIHNKKELDEFFQSL